MFTSLTPVEFTILLSGLCIVAMMYAMVGHGGGSGYIAVLALASFAPETLRPIALTLNVFVATISTFAFNKKSQSKPSLLIPLILTSIPCSFIGGLIQLDPSIYKPVLGVVLALAAVRLFIKPKQKQTHAAPLIIVLFLGATIGLVSGMIGIGGGIFLSPILLLCGFATARETAAVSAPFILCNSIAALIGVMASEPEIGELTLNSLPLAFGVIVGGVIGAIIGSRKLGQGGLRMMLGIVLAIAAVKMFL